MMNPNSIAHTIADKSIIGKEFQTIRPAILSYDGEMTLVDSVDDRIYTNRMIEGKVEIIFQYIKFAITNIYLETELVIPEVQILDIGDTIEARKVLNSKWSTLETYNSSFIIGVKALISFYDFFESYPFSTNAPLTINDTKLSDKTIENLTHGVEKLTC